MAWYTQRLMFGKRMVRVSLGLLVLVTVFLTSWTVLVSRYQVNGGNIRRQDSVTLCRCKPPTDHNNNKNNNNGRNKTNNDRPYKTTRKFSKTKHVSVKTNKNQSDLVWTNFRFDLDMDMLELVRNVKDHIPVTVKPVFVYTYEFKFFPRKMCVSGKPAFIFLIKSAVKNFARRTAIRETWANNGTLVTYNIVRMFLVGSTDNQSYTSAVLKENNIHNDILQMSFHDDYYNNTLKTVGAIHWAVQYCNRSDFVIFVDDDMFVATPRLSNFLKTKVKKTSSFFGGYIEKHHPQRDRRSKWYVSEKDYPYKIYPTMPSAGFMIMSMNFVVDVHIASQYTKKFIYDDCFLAMVAYKLRITPVSVPNVGKHNIPIIDERFKTVLAAHQYSPYQLKQAWSFLKNITILNRTV